MRSVTRVTLLGAAVAVQLAATGCIGLGGGGSGSGSGSLFDDSGSSGFGSNDSESGSNGGVFADGGSGFGDEFGVATTHNPEPASLALFGTGLAGVGLWRRRKASKRSS